MKIKNKNGIQLLSDWVKIIHQYHDEPDNRVVIYVREDKIEEFNKLSKFIIFGEHDEIEPTNELLEAVVAHPPSQKDSVQANLSFEQNKIGIPEEIQFYIENQEGILRQPIFVSKEIREVVEKSGLFSEKDKLRFISKP